MSFNKRFISKENIINNFGNVKYISNLVNADALLMDNWSSKFFDNFNFKWEDYQKERKIIVDKYIFSSNLSDTKSDIGFDNLKSLSNILMNLETDPKWIDILLASEMIDVEIEEPGVFNYLVNIYKESIKKLYE